MEKKLLSIILPCYNVDKYISECLDSLFSQDLPEEDYEILCVDDCSTDGTREIILEYRKEHPNLFLIQHDFNQKQGAARNTGLKHAKGEYIWFVDPDDYVESNILKKLFSEIVDLKLDIIFFDYQKVSDKGEVLNKINFEYTSDIQQGKLIFSRDEFWNITSLCWIRIVRKDFLIENNIYFFDTFFYEDIIFGIKCFLLASRVKYISLIGYNYRNNPTSNMNTIDGAEKLSAMVNLAQQYYEIGLSITDDDSLSIIFKSISLYYLNSVFKPIIYLNKIERYKFYKFITLIEKLYLIKDICSLKMKFLLFAPKASKALLFIVAPVINILKKLK